MKPSAPVSRAASLLNLYTSIVAAAGVLLVVSLAPTGITTVWKSPLALGSAAVGAVLGEFAGVHVRWRSKGVYYTMASPFVLAVLAIWGLPAALLTAGVAALLDDWVNRSGLRKTLFNLGQGSLSLGAAGLLYGLLADGPVVSWQQAPAFCAAAVVNLVLSEVAVLAAVALDRQAPSPSHLLSHGGLHLVTIALNVGLTLAVLLAVPERGIVPVMLAVAVVPAYVACRSATRERQARERAEASQHQAETQKVLAEKAQAEAEAARADADRGRAEAQELAAERAHSLEVAERLVRRLHAQGRQKNENLALVAYDLQEPLSQITSIATSLRDGRQRFSADDRQQFLDAMLEHCQGADETIQRLMLGARHHRTQPTVEQATEVIDPVEQLRWAGELANLIYRRPILVQVTQALPVRAFPDAVEDVLSALLENADCYSLEGRPILLEGLCRQGEVVLAVQDHGPGIAPEDRDRIFDQFTRLHPETGDRLGMGLHIARSVARRQGGELTAVDPVGSRKGARFELTLPIASTTL